MLLILAWACGQRRIMPCSMPGRLMSKLYFAVPVALAGPSIRWTLVPIRRRFLGHEVGMIHTPFPWFLHSSAMVSRICSLVTKRQMLPIRACLFWAGVVFGLALRACVF